MSIPLTWSEIAVRLLCAVAAGAMIGVNRTERGHAAGLRTAILVSLAACLAMVQVNVLLPLAGRPSDSFVMNDLMRLPLGILSGMGFIGAGAIVRRDNFVVGVTTAATLWFLTVLGLCFGGGQILLGWAGTALGLVVLTGVKRLEALLHRDHQGELVIATVTSGPDDETIRAFLNNAGLELSATAIRSDHESREFSYQVRWRAKPDEPKIPQSVQLFMNRQDILRVVWKPQAR
jgi:putative Mg2+ transporter-C (MgtC) family protein